MKNAGFQERITRLKDILECYVPSIMEVLESAGR